MKTQTLKIFTAALIFCFSCNSAGDKNDTQNNVDKTAPYFDTYKMGKCIDNCKDPEKIFKKEFSNNSLDLKFGAWLCCTDHSAYPKVVGDTLFIDFNINDSVAAACLCYFNIEGVIKNIQNDPKVIMVGGHRLGELSIAE